MIEAFAKVDIFIYPTKPTTAFKNGKKLDDPFGMFLSDVATIPMNIAGLPRMSLPIGLATADN